MDRKSITDIKAAFVRSQVLLLGTPLYAHPVKQDLQREIEDGALTEKQIQDAINKINEKIKKHNALVYSKQSQRHIAEQIEQLHWNNIASEADRAHLDTVVVRKDADLTDTQEIERTPEYLEDTLLNPVHQPTEEERTKFRQLRKKMLELSKIRDEKRSRLVRYSELQSLLEPLDDPAESVQPNLVTRDGQLSKELDRMRMLLARLTPHIANPTNTTTNATKRAAEQSVTNEAKLARIMDIT